MVKEAVKLGRVCIVHDQLGDWEYWAQNGEDYLKNGCVRIETGKSAEEVAELALYNAPCTLVYDEVSLALPNRTTHTEDSAAQQILQFGRHSQVGLVGCTQRPAMCSVAFRSLATDFFVFQLRGARDLNWVDENIDDGVAAKARDLAPLQYIHFEV
jgi:hypothetical protein